MLAFWRQARVMCENSFDRNHDGQMWHCTSDEEIRVKFNEMTDPQFNRHVRRTLKGMGWTLRPVRCPYCAAGRPDDE